MHIKQRAAKVTSHSRTYYANKGVVLSIMDMSCVYLKDKSKRIEFVNKCIEALDRKKYAGAIQILRDIVAGWETRK